MLIKVLLWFHISGFIVTNKDTFVVLLSLFLNWYIISYNLKF